MALEKAEELKAQMKELIDKAKDALANNDVEGAKKLKADIEESRKLLDDLEKTNDELEKLESGLGFDDAEKQEEVSTEEKPAEEQEDTSVDDAKGEVKVETEEKTETEEETESVKVNEPTEEELEEIEKKKKKKEAKRNMAKFLNENQETNEAVQGFAEFIKSKGATRDNVKSDDVGVTIPEDIKYAPEKEVNTVQDLSQYVTKTSVNTASGKHPILKRVTAKFNTVLELEANPELAKPEFQSIAWEVQTYRGAIPVSEEAIADSAVNLTSIIAENIQEQKVNTLNEKIGAVLKTFTAKTVASVDDLKAITNVELDPGYDRQIICTQSFYQGLDTLKDGNGRYLLQDSIINTAGNKVLGMNVTVVRDDLLGANGDAVAFIGDVKRGVFFADRSDMSVQWQEHNIYGRYLMGAFRFDVKKADENAGFFVTANFAADATPEG
ncbi:phage major capsid protein [Mammaliicoccus sciuri]|uniref:phage major capsid protein n=1 Tax=Mammaliicoccus sciuri TaxID=1296 RepID=UPI0018E10AE8|nr:phage major capsid protein [Mammaliicoccus sciuri]QQC96566.1 phage major capsid protein [Mammaliicoccus sciuri]